MKNTNKVAVFFGNEEVGMIAQPENENRTVFQYSPSWLRNGFSISPISLPLENRVFISEREPFDGMFGVFNDSLPDGWGRLITDRYLKNHGIDPLSITPLTRLTLLGPAMTGSLHYEPAVSREEAPTDTPDLDTLFSETRKILKDEGSDTFIDEFYIRGSSSNGARPKIEIDINKEAWIVKFPSAYDSPDMGIMEYDYSRTARMCNIETAEFTLLKSNLTKGFFASRRFDRPVNKTHMVSVSGLLEASHREPALDYKHLFKLSWILSKDIEEQKRVFDLMCFNVFSHNQDDHSKNFSFIYNVTEGKWKLSPAYDITYSMTAWNEQSTTVNGKGKNITAEDMIELGLQSGLEKEYLIRRTSDIKTVVDSELATYISPSK